MILDYYFAEGKDPKDQFPIVYLTLIVSFALILWIEKIATDAGHFHEEHS